MAEEEPPDCTCTDCVGARFDVDLDSLEVAPGLSYRDVERATDWMENEAWNDGMLACVRRLRAGLIDVAARAAQARETGQS